MFDKTPANLPTDPEDMLLSASGGDGEGGAAEAPSLPPPPRVMPQSVDLGPSALEAGKLRPAANTGVPPAPPMPPGEGYEVKRSFLGSKAFAISVGVVVLVIVVIGGVWIFARNPSGKKTVSTQPAAEVVPATPAEVSLESMLEGNEEAPAATSEEATGETTGEVAPAETSAPEGAAAPAPENTDTDADGLTDSEEAQSGTMANNPDSDNDGLTDGAEVKIWKTDPLKADSDGDTYSDGAEVKNGYNPNGAGKLFETPKE